MRRHKRARRGISAGTVFVLLLTALTVGMGVWIVPRLIGDIQDIQIDPERLLNALSDTIDQSGASRAALNAENKVDPARTEPSASAPEVQPSAGPTAVPTRMLSIMAAGNLMVPKNVRQSGYDAETKTYDYNEIFSEIKPLFSSADLALCTVESVFGGEGTTYDEYNAPDAMLDALKYAGVDMLSLGNEHALEYGLEGLRSTMMAMESKGFMVTGAVANKEDVGRTQVFQVNGVQIAVMGYSYGISTQAQKMTKKDDRYATPLLTPEDIGVDIANARKAGADVVIVMPHWGTRNSAKVDNTQKRLAEQLVGMGADLVLGSHPNVVQRAEYVRATASDGSTREGFVAYSMGSLLSDGREENAAAILMHFDLQVDQQTRTVRVMRYGYVPTWIMRARTQDGKFAYSILRADDEDAAAALETGPRKNMAEALKMIQKALAEGGEVPVYWP